jgi:hypothetical protein
MGWTTKESGFDSQHGARDFSLLHNIQTSFEAHLAYYPMDTGGMFSQG